MAKITTQFAFFKTKAAYNTQMSGDGISDTTIIFIKDTQEIITHGAKICSMQDIISLLETDYLPKTGGAVTGDLWVQGTFTTDTDIHVGGIQITNGTADQILLGNGGVTSLQALKDTISAIPKFHIVVVDALPSDEEVKSESTIYLVKSGNDSQNLYTEYIWINGAWEKLGEQKLDLSGYALKSDVAAKMPTSATVSNNSGEIELLFGNAAGQYLFSASIEPATATAPGLMSASDKAKLDLISWYEGN